MEQVHYSVLAGLSTQALRDEYVAWLAPGHVRAVREAGASSVRVIVLDHGGGAGEPYRVLAVYTFASREAFAHYAGVHAPRLRAEGLGLFSGRGITYERQVGEVVYAG